MMSDGDDEVPESNEVINSPSEELTEEPLDNTADPCNIDNTSPSDTSETPVPITTKVMSVAASASKTVVSSASAAAKITGEAWKKTAASAGEVLNKDKEKSGGEKTGNDKEGEKSASGEEKEGMWGQVRRVSGTVSGTLATSASKAWSTTTSTIAKVTQPENKTAGKAVATEEGKTDADESSGDDVREPADTASEDPTVRGSSSDENTTTEPPVEGRKRGDSVTKLWSSVRRLSATAADSIVEGAKEAYKVAEPVAVSTASKVSHSAQTAWSVTRDSTVSVVERVRARARREESQSVEGSVDGGSNADTNSLNPEVSGSQVSSVDGDAVGAVESDLARIEETKEEEQSEAEKALEEPLEKEAEVIPPSTEPVEVSPSKSTSEPPASAEPEVVETSKE
mmetsp:Transcript_1080/g.1734  ORF Transcript_1080/g.1734 Transcript_1080/m.1734 type:complete len:397 (+) Transcript_1080:65-1255(+)